MTLCQINNIFLLIKWKHREEYVRIIANPPITPLSYSHWKVNIEMEDLNSMSD